MSVMPVSGSGPRGTAAAVAAWTGLVLCETLAQVALKAAGDSLGDVPLDAAWLLAVATNPWAIAGVLGYLGSFVSWMVVLDRMPLSLGFPLTSVCYITVAAASVVLFGEVVGLVRGAGIGLIMLGVAIIGTEGD
jgi:drug/metabolite transporter (DMT)-like permease